MGNNIVSLETTLRNALQVLDVAPTGKEQFLARWEEWKKNGKLEAICIVASDIGNLAGTSLGHLYELSKAHINEIAAVLSTITGGTYASIHTRIDAKKEGRPQSAYETLTAVGATESGCIIATAFVNLVAGISAGNYSLLSPEALTRRFIGYLLSWPIGTVAMSELTLLQKIEMGEIIAENGALEDLEKYLTPQLKLVSDSYPKPQIRWGKSLRGNIYLRIEGKGSHLDIVQRGLSRGQRVNYNPIKKSSYGVRSPLNMYRDVEEPLMSFAETSLEKTGRKPTIIKKVIHDHRH